MGSLAKSPASSSTWLILRQEQKGKTADMDAIRKKMQSLKSETDGLYNTIDGFEEATREAAARADQADCDIRDYGKKVQQLEIGFDETNDKLTKATESLEEAEKQFKEVESDVSALTRRIMLMEEEDKKSAEQLCQTITKLALTSKAADMATGPAGAPTLRGEWASGSRKSLACRRKCLVLVLGRASLVAPHLGWLAPWRATRSITNSRSSRGGCT